MKCLFDMSDLDTSKKYYSINLYKYRILDAIQEKDYSKILLILNDSNVEYITKKYPYFKYVIYTEKKDILSKIPLINHYIASIRFAAFINNIGGGTFFTASNIDYKITKRLKIRKVCVIHDIKAIWEGNSIIKKLLQIYRVKNYYRKLINNSDVTIAISNFTRQNILENISGINEKKLVVIYNSVVVSEKSIKPAGFNNSDYILYVNSLDEYKNIVTLVKSFILLKDRITNDLVIVASPNEYYRTTIIPLIEKAKITHRVHLYSNVPDYELHYIYEHARIFVSPSLNEGFGYTPLEAAICMCPVLCSKCEALPDTTQGKLNYYEKATDEKELANRLYSLINNQVDKEDLANISKYFNSVYSPSKHQSELFKVLKL